MLDKLFRVHSEKNGAAMIVDYRDVELGDRIGGGSFGEVHMALWRSTPVAAKVIKLMPGGDAKQKQAALDDFVAEARILGRTLGGTGILGWSRS